MSQDKLTPEQVQHEFSKITEEYEDAKAVIKSRRDAKLAILQSRCPHKQAGYRPGSTWCPDCEGIGREEGKPTENPRAGRQQSEPFGGREVIAPPLAEALALTRARHEGQ